MNKRERLPSAPLDPAAMIAAALKRKFAHRDNDNSDDDWAEKEKELVQRRAAKAASPPKVSRGVDVCRVP